MCFLCGFKSSPSTAAVAPSASPRPDSTAADTPPAVALPPRTGWHRFRNDLVPGKEYMATSEEHLANIWTHGVAILLAAAALVDMLRIADSEPKAISAWIYGFALISLFSVSTVYHIVSYKQASDFLIRLFKLGDRVMIFVFIAGSYTPWIILVDLPDNWLWGETMMVLIWSIALFGTVFSSYFTLTMQRSSLVELIELALYLVLGWTAMFVYEPLMNSAAPSMALVIMLLGGLSFSVGVLFFRADGRLPFAHAIWHLFVVLGCGLHYYSVGYELMPSIAHPSTVHRKAF